MAQAETELPQSEILSQDAGPLLTLKLYFESLNTKKITDNRVFWKTVVPLFTNKTSRGEKIIHNEAEKHISDDKKMCTIFNNFFKKNLSQT